MMETVANVKIIEDRLRRIDMISAQEAAIKSEEAMRKNVTSELKEIEDLISQEILRGERMCCYDGSISGAVKKEMERLGYEVTTGVQYNESYVIIRW